MDAMTTQFEALVEAVDQRLESIEKTSVPGFRQQVGELVNDLLEMYRMGFEQVMYYARSYPDLPQKFADDPVLGPLLMIHNMHPLSFEERVHKALDNVRPYLKTHDGNVRLLSVEQGIVKLALEGHCHGCPSSRVTIKTAIEQELMRWAPDMLDLIVEGEDNVLSIDPDDARRVVIPLSAVQGVTTENKRPKGWFQLDNITSLLPGQTHKSQLEDHPLIIARLGDEFFAYHDFCPQCHRLNVLVLITNDDLSASILECQSCQTQYEPKKAGRAVSQASLHLEPLPLLLEGHTARIAIPVAE
ncbi:NifU family protein [Sulfobacillus thermosulfidooxidans]|uniref:NifU family protein n=1 Tax=Sulfobacillus thermosulfidooxidans TaxID=28034 RepID=UPI0006B57569|nr:NifU family protein [Sulfobacillus thermosulfidooxidans]